MTKRASGKVTYFIVKMSCCGVNHVPFKEWDVGASEQECDLCGSHGEVSLDFKCKCGKFRHVVFKSW